METSTIAEANKKEAKKMAEPAMGNVALPQHAIAIQQNAMSIQHGAVGTQRGTASRGICSGRGSRKRNGRSASHVSER